MAFQIEVYGRLSCPYCVRAKNILEELEGKDLASGRFVDMEKEGITKEDLAVKAGKEVRTVPQVWVDGKHVGGCDNLVAFLKERKVAFKS